MNRQIRLFSGNASNHLVPRIAELLSIDPSPAIVGRFNDGEVRIELQADVRGADVFIINSTPPPAENFFEMMLLGKAARMASAGRVTLVIPYLGYNRQDRKDRPRVPVAAKAAIETLKLTGADRALLLDLHSEATAAHFEPMVTDHLYSSHAAVPYLHRVLNKSFVVASPDKGGTARALQYAQYLGQDDCVIFSKRRVAPGMVDKRIQIIGSVKNKDVLFVDDMIDTGGTMIADAEAAKKAGAKRIFAYATHGILSGNALDNLSKSAFTQVFLTDTVLTPEKLSGKNGKFVLISVAPLLAQAIRRIHQDESLSSLILKTK
ncbi:ribose-phosphate pyrophosphokinase [bacterium]|nr:ribose-phosphate pyrophosphokinase [bacterium]